MQRVMQKLDAKTRESQAASGPDATADGASAQDAQGLLTTPPTASEPTDPSAFVPNPSATPQTAAPINDQRTVVWDADKLDSALVAFRDRYSAFSEQYRSLRARLLNMNPQNSHQMLAITSSLPQEGKSVTTINLGLAMAEGNERQVVIVDADFRRASMARMLGLPPEPGLAELIRGSAPLSDTLRPTPFPNLKVITAGTNDDKKYEDLVGTSAARAVLGELRERFDYALLDTPPVNTVSDVSMLAPHCDGAILVIEMRRTPEPTVQEAVRTLQTTNVKILGCVLSRYRNERGHYYERYYSYYYGSD